MNVTTWTEVCGHLVATYPTLAAPRADARELRLGGILVEVSLTPVLEAPWLTVSSPIGSLRHLSQMELLTSNASATIGAFCTRDGTLRVRQTLPLPLLAPHLDESIRAIAELASWSRRRLAEMA